MYVSKPLKLARQLLETVKDRDLPFEERVDNSVQLAALILQASKEVEDREGRRMREQIGKMITDPLSKHLTLDLIDQSFRSQKPGRIANQIIYLLRKYGEPGFLDPFSRLGLKILSRAGKNMCKLLLPLISFVIRRNCKRVVIPAEDKAFQEYLLKRADQSVRVNLNRLGEALLGEQEALDRLNQYISDLQNPAIEHISVKPSTLYSQISYVGREDTLYVLQRRLRKLYRESMIHDCVRPNGTRTAKFVNLDMEEFKDFHLTLELFQSVLSEPEFKDCYAGIVLQAYLPDSFKALKDLSRWASERRSQGGAPIKVRLVKGANLAMEKVLSAQNNWACPVYPKKVQVDANFKSMLHFITQHDRYKSVHMSIGSHNLFDISYSLILSYERGCRNYISFEMLEGMAEHYQTVIHQLSEDMLVYAPTVKKKDFHVAVAYLLRRLDENTAKDNFLRDSFHLEVGSEKWQSQSELFRQSCEEMASINHMTRSHQNRAHIALNSLDAPFINESNTNWSLPESNVFKEVIYDHIQKLKGQQIPIVLGGKALDVKRTQRGVNPSDPSKPWYVFSTADENDIELAISTAEQTYSSWAAKSDEDRIVLMKQVGKAIQSQRAKLIAAMMTDVGKVADEADIEVSEAIDFCHYYAHSMYTWKQFKHFEYKGKGPVVVASPWNFACAIPTGSIASALVAGNTVIFKPAKEALLVGWILVNAFWNAGVPKDVLQFIIADDEPYATMLVTDPRIQAVILTGGTQTARRLIEKDPNLELYAETGGKNTLIVSSLCDRDEAIRDIIHSAFGFGGQKCSACSIAILEKELYDDPNFLKQLKDAASSLHVGRSDDKETKVGPLIQPPSGKLLKALTTLEPSEEWLLQPKARQDNPFIWSPGIKKGTVVDSYTYQTEFFGPILSLVRASSFSHALDLANQTPYGLTAGLHTLDEREKQLWSQKIEAGNLYINRGITGAIVQRQPFGGCKLSSYGRHLKAGGPNYLLQLMHIKETHLPEEREQMHASITAFKEGLSDVLYDDEMNEWSKAVSSYSYFWKYYFQREYDPSQVLGESNRLVYKPYNQVFYFYQPTDTRLDVYRIIAAATICSVPLTIMGESSHLSALMIPCFESIEGVQWRLLEKEKLLEEASALDQVKARVVSKLPAEQSAMLVRSFTSVNPVPVYNSGRLELLNYLREVAISSTEHRYGNISTDQ